MNPVIEKARKINNDSSIYGTFAEIGAGQEVARYFFLAGKASQTIAKTMSAYDMVFSDEIYGKEESGRYVCQSRLHKMLDKEYSLLDRRLKPIRGQSTRFFSFADTVATGDLKKRQPHGWLGVRFQLNPEGPVNEIILHVRLLDKFRLLQQEALGILGVNLIEAAFYQTQDRVNLITRLVDNLKEGQVAIDLIKFSGPDLKHFDNRLMNLELVKRGLSESVFFDAKGEIQPMSDALYQRPLLIQRGTYRPITNTHLEIITKGREQLLREHPNLKREPLSIFELTMSALEVEGEISEQDFLDRVESLTSLGFPVIVSNFSLFYRLKRHLRSFSSEPLVIIMGASHIAKLFDEAVYQDLEGGLLEGLGRLFNQDTQVYVYPHKTAQDCTTLMSFKPSPATAKVLEHFIHQELIKDISGCDQAGEYVHSKDIQAMIKKKDPKWMDLVPISIKDKILTQGLFQLLP